MVYFKKYQWSLINSWWAQIPYSCIQKQTGGNIQHQQDFNLNVKSIFLFSQTKHILFDLMLWISANNFSVMSRKVFLGTEPVLSSG